MVQILAPNRLWITRIGGIAPTIKGIRRSATRIFPNGGNSITTIISALRARDHLGLLWMPPTLLRIRLDVRNVAVNAVCVPPLAKGGRGRPVEAQEEIKDDMEDFLGEVEDDVAFLALHEFEAYEAS
jgi:hypothetical protein